MNSLTFENLTFERNQRVLFDPLNGKVESGECLQIQGANGSGKSTLLRLLAGLLTSEMGEIRWQNQSIFRQLDDYQQQLHYVGHRHGVRYHLTVLENIKLYGEIFLTKTGAHAGAKQKQRDILSRLKLDTVLHRQAQHLSAGQLRRFSLAKLLLHPRPLWILDEPTASLDNEGQQLFATLMQEHLRTDGMAIVATHSPFDWKTICLTLS